MHRAYAQHSPLILVLAFVATLSLALALYNASAQSILSGRDTAADAHVPIYGYVANLGEDTVSVIDLLDVVEVARVPVGEGPYQVSLTPDERWVWVTNSFSNTVSIINTATNVEEGRVRVGNLPRGLDIGSDGLAYVVNTGEASVSVVDTVARAVVTTVVGLPTNVWDVVVSPDGNYAYLTTEGASGEIYRLTFGTWETATLLSGVAGCGAGIDISPDGKTLYIADPCRKALRVVNLGDETWSERELTLGQGAWEVAFSPIGGLAFVSNEFLPPPSQGLDTISVVETAGHSELRIVAVDHAPIGMAPLGNGRYLYVTNWGSGTVSLVDMEPGEVVATIAVGDKPWGIAIQGTQLALSKTDWLDPVPRGWADHYVITLRNNSGRELHDIVVQDLLPKGADFVSTMGTGGTYQAASHQVEWHIARLYPGEEIRLYLRFRPASGLSPGTVLTNEVVASCSEGLLGYDWEDTTVSEPPTPAPAPTESATPTPSMTLIPSATPTASPTLPETQTPTNVPTATPTETRTPKPTLTMTPTEAATATWTPTATDTATLAPTPTSATAELLVRTWFDLDGDGEVDTNEPPLADVFVVVGGASGLLTGFTDVRGEILFPFLAPGSYTVETGDLERHLRTTDSSQSILLGPSEMVEVAFGYRLPPTHLPFIATGS